MSLFGLIEVTGASPPSILGSGAYQDLSAVNFTAELSSGTYTDWKSAVRVATVTNISLSGLQTIDDVVLAEGDRILVKDQTNGVEMVYIW